MGTFYSFGPGSAGNSTEVYSIRLMFFLPTGRTLKLEENSDCTLLSHRCHIKGENNQYLLTASGFSTEEAAFTFLRKICAGLIWYGIENSTGIKFDPDVAPIDLFDKPKSIGKESMLHGTLEAKGWDSYDGDYYFDKTSIIPEHKRLVKHTLGSVTARMDTPLTSFARVVTEGMEHRFSDRTLSDPKFRLACEVYLSSHFENSSGAAFLSRISALEILAADVPSSEPVREMVTRFVEEAQSRKDAESREELRQEFQSLISRLAFLKNRSIKSRIRILVTELLSGELGDEDAAEEAILVSRLYDLRSTMVHSGEVDPAKIREGSSKLNEIVPKLLRTIYRKLSE